MKKTNVDNLIFMQTICKLPVEHSRERKDKLITIIHYFVWKMNSDKILKQNIISK